jgi:biotin synthase-like enzyme
MLSTKCKFCDSSAYGKTGDSRHPQGVHVYTSDGQHCIYCGSSALGKTGDSRHPEGVHQR